ncbi:MAG TPA: M50 family metallopeptidase [Fimbriimonadaceae bacterium]|nr:M50 family metallopeptidase [Fimbriimonadaceae bacterium]
MKAPNGETLRPHQSTLVLAAVVSVVLWLVPYCGWLLLPLVYLNTHIHEMCHALIAVGTGGQVEFIRVFANGGGVTPVMGGNLTLISTAGYIGATIIGGLMIWFSRSEKGSATMLRILAVLLLISLLMWVRGDWVGLLSSVFWIAALFAIPSLLKRNQLVFAAQFLGLQQCLNSIQGLYVLLKISAYGGPDSDATNMARYTGIPAMFWALLWGAIGLGMLWVTLRSAWKSRPAP